MPAKDKPSNLKKLVDERRKPVIAHHSNWLGIEPHELNYETSIHAGTMQAANDRLVEGLQATLDDSDYEPGEVMDAYLHSYEIPRHLIDPVTRLDPLRSSDYTLRHSNTSRKRVRRVPEVVSHDSNRVLKYENRVEDPGSTSYLIPSGLVHDGRVKHLGMQFLTSYEITEDRDLDFTDPKLGFNKYGEKLRAFED